MIVNRVIRTMLVSDFYINSGLSLFGPVYAIFVAGNIAGATIATVGFAAAISQIVKVCLEIPISRYLDKNHGEYDDYYSLVTGNFIIALVPFLYLFASKVHHIYLIEALMGVGVACAVPPWHAIFSRHLDKNEENFEWSLKSISIGLAIAGAAAVGGLMAQRFGFDIVFILGGFVALIGAFIQMKIYKGLKGRVPRGQVHPQPQLPK